MNGKIASLLAYCERSGMAEGDAVIEWISSVGQKRALTLADLRALAAPVPRLVPRLVQIVGSVGRDGAFKVTLEGADENARGALRHLVRVLELHGDLLGDEPATPAPEPAP